MFSERRERGKTWHGRDFGHGDGVVRWQARPIPPSPTNRVGDGRTACLRNSTAPEPPLHPTFIIRFPPAERFSPVAARHEADYHPARHIPI